MAVALVAVDGLPVLGNDGYVSVEQLAALRHVTPAAVRAQLGAGSIAGERVTLDGQKRKTWRIPVSEAQRYLAKPAGHRSAGTGADAPDEGPLATEPLVAPPAPPTAPPTAPPSAPAVQQAASALPSGDGDRIAVLEAENRRLRAQLAAVLAANRALLDAMDAGQVT